MGFPIVIYTYYLCTKIDYSSETIYNSIAVNSLHLKLEKYLFFEQKIDNFKIQVEEEKKNMIPAFYLTVLYSSSIIKSYYHHKLHCLFTFQIFMIFPSLQRERKQRKLYADEFLLGDDDFETGRGFSVAEKLESPLFAQQGMVREMKGTDLNVA